MIESWNIVSRKSLLKQQNSALILHWAPGFSNVFQSFQPSVRTESAVGIEEGKWKLGLFTGSCALICLQNCQTPSAPRSSSDQKVKTKSHLFPSRDLVSQLWILPPLEWGHQVLICGSGVFTAGIRVLGSTGLAQNVSLGVHLVPGSVFPSLLFYKMGNHIS